MLLRLEIQLLDFNSIVSYVFFYFWLLLVDGFDYLCCSAGSFAG